MFLELRHEIPYRAATLTVNSPLMYENYTAEKLMNDNVNCIQRIFLFFSSFFSSIHHRAI